MFCTQESTKSGIYRKFYPRTRFGSRKLTLQVQCENQCAKGPNIIVNNVEYNNVDEKKLEEILSQAV